MPTLQPWHAANFYPRSPCGERRLHNAGQDGLCHISIHALLAESDSSSPSGSGRLWVFLSTLSLRRATKQRSKIRRPLLYFYPRSPCGERPDRLILYDREVYISIHALLAESDQHDRDQRRHRGNFYPRSPCGERLTRTTATFGCRIFLSTLSLRRATARPNGWIFTEYIFLSTLSLRRATHEKRLDRWPIVFLSTLSLRRATSPQGGKQVESAKFLSTLSLRRATKSSIAAVPRALFLSTLSLRRATTRPAFLFYVAVISIHALLAESDTCWRTARLLRNYFYPRSPCGERP